MIKRVVRIRCDACFTEFKRNDFVTVLRPKMEFAGGVFIEHVCRNCYNDGYMGLSHQEIRAEALTKEWKDSNGI